MRRQPTGGHSWGDNGMRHGPTRLAASQAGNAIATGCPEDTLAGSA
jgi:hypothetical protein